MISNSLEVSHLCLLGGGATISQPGAQNGKKAAIIYCTMKVVIKYITV